MRQSTHIPDHCRYVAVNPENHHLSIASGPVPTPAAGEVLIKVHSAGINRADLLQRNGLYPPPQDASPILGLEVSGTVQAVGINTGKWQVGDRVCALTHGGGYAEYAVAPIGQCLPIPTGFSKEKPLPCPRRCSPSGTTCSSARACRQGKKY